MKAINNLGIARLAKLAGAPDVPAAGLQLHVRVGDQIEPEQPLMTMHAETDAELAYPLAYAAATPDTIIIED